MSKVNSEVSVNSEAGVDLEHLFDAAPEWWKGDQNGEWPKLDDSEFLALLTPEERLRLYAPPAFSRPIGKSSSNDVESAKPTRKEAKKTENPERLCFPGSALVGSLGDLARLLARGTEVPEEFYFACGLTVVGAICGTRLRLNVAVECEARLYTVLLGESYDVKKSTAMRRTLAFFEDVPCGDLPSLSTRPVIIYGVGSAEGLVKKLHASPQLILACDEFRAFVDKSKVQGSVLLPMVTSLFESTSWDNATKGRTISVRNAHLSLLGCCTLDTYSQMWTPEAIAIGFPNRLFLVVADRKRKVPWPESPDPAALVEIRERISQQLQRLPLTFDITQEAKAVWGKWYTSLPASEHTKRLDTIGFRLLPLIALTTDKDCIGLETVETVTAILDYELRVRVMADPIGADNRIAELEEKIRRVLKTRGPLTKNELRRFTNANRYGIWAFEKALSGLQYAARDVELSGERYRLSAKAEEGR